MPSKDLPDEISDLQGQLDLLNKKFDDALERDITLIHTRKILEEVRILQYQIAELSKKNINKD